MGFGAIIVMGENNTPLDEDLAGCLVEVRVEQSLDEPTQFAVRFLDDIEDGGMRLANDDRLAVETLVTIAVEVDQALVALVRGPIIEHRSQITIGGPGSLFEIHGLDCRDLLDRVCVQAAWTGRASDIARQILSQAFTDLNIEDTTRVYESGRETLNQRDTDLAFVNRLARRNNLHLWVTYDAARSPLGGGLRITETANFASSPRRPTSGALGDALSALTSALPLAPTTPLELRVHVPPSQCPNVVAFQVNTDTSRPSRYRAGAMQIQDPDPTTIDASDPQPRAGQGAQRLGQLGNVTRELCMPGAADPQDTQTRGEAALTEAGWFVQATASTTRHLLGGVLKPHDVITVVGVGPRLGRAAFRIKQVTHVINAAEHYMDTALEGNGLGG
jgi:hypothetical protein